MTTSDQEEQAERRRVLLQDADLRQQQQEQAQREQVSTFFSHTHADEINGGGRFAAVSPASIVGSEPAVKYPAASPSWHCPTNRPCQLTKIRRLKTRLVFPYLHQSQLT